MTERTLALFAAAALAACGGSAPGPDAAPACLRVKVGTPITIEASALHPLEARQGGAPGNPITPQSSPIPVVFTAPGFYPFQCAEHVDEGMSGVAWVVPE